MVHVKMSLLRQLPFPRSFFFQAEDGIRAFHVTGVQTLCSSDLLEQRLVDKDRALEARDARIATLQDELSERLGALQRLNAMDLSLQGLDSKMSERLRSADVRSEERRVG